MCMVQMFIYVYAPVNKGGGNGVIRQFWEKLNETLMERHNMKNDYSGI